MKNCGATCRGGRALGVVLLLGLAGAWAATDERLAPSSDSQDTGVLTGIDVLVRDNFHPLKGRRVGLITNQTGIDRLGRSTIELLRAAPDVKLVVLFSPEHGLKGALDERVADSKDPLSGLKVYSLYGKTTRPTDEMLEGVDTLVYDIQDIGTRFYTYPATMGFAMEEAAKRKLKFVVLDRPNPITGTRVFGPCNDREGEFTAYHKVPLVHGLTMGEFAQMINEERKINVDLEVIRLEGWRRSMWFDETLLPWVNPSPNMRSLTEATLYPAIGMLEACDLSVGRGTDTPFERIGAPWIDGRKLAVRLNRLGLKGVRFVPFQFTPTSSNFKGQECGGVQVLLTDRNAFDPLETGLALTWELKDLFSEKFNPDAVDRLLFCKKLVEQVKAAQAPTGFMVLWQKDLDDFTARRAKYLIYE